MKRLLTYEFGTIKLYENYVLAQINEGVTVTVEASMILRDIAENHYKDRFFAYISHRKYSYSVNPAVYIEASKINNLVAFAIVSHIPLALHNTQIESRFSKKAYMSFEIISEAKIWATKLVKEQSKIALKKSKVKISV
ncbi:hypothetical protein FNB79_08410 [Formosa sediminum]|uniref:STAS/SEC14 domain-containing protein n=1 Tax=Formosa sediminum TaxID=2594004 RepID=A0A516GR55_9FLAO|nr:hypothetical protein [Formosa sediminum]QDO94004.1 hypothetical protein FNB79_08410 [Formosa sediminum]